MGSIDPEPKKQSLREAMPIVTEFIDACREAFGAEMVNTQIRLGMQGAETFYASENSIEIGTKFKEPKVFLTVDQMRVLSREETAIIAKTKKQSNFSV